MWTMKLMAWIECDRTPTELAKVFKVHYAAASQDHYHTIGRFLSGIISTQDLLATIRAPKQRCEIAYYIGFNHRMIGQFDKAADWYLICCETGLMNNGEYHWAADELFWWAHMGILHRHKKIIQDINAFKELP